MNASKWSKRYSANRKKPKPIWQSNRPFLKTPLLTKTQDGLPNKSWESQNHRP